MSDPRIPTSAAGPAGQTAGTGAARQVLEGSLTDGTGVVPDARLRTAFLGQAFVWMFLGLIVSAGIAYVVQSNVTLLRFAYENTFILLIAQIAPRGRHQLGDQQDQRDRRADAVLRLRGVDGPDPRR